MKASIGQRSISLGVGLALASAVAFGLTIPLLGWAGAGVGPFTTAALLYLGASAAALVQKTVVAESGAPFTRRSVAPLLVMAFSGAALAPTLLAWGLLRTGPVTGGLLLNLEVVWTVVLARALFRESLGPRVLVAMGLMLFGGSLLALGEGGVFDPLGAVAITGATLGWAVDNAASRRLAELRPLTVVGAKAALGAALTLGLALAWRETFPAPWQAGVLLAAGATGYGASLRFYLLAQRAMGAARTASVFALAPFIGAALGLLLVPAAFGWRTAIAAACFAAGAVLHLSERHGHQHRHDRLEHDHAHRHDDGHHLHAHAEVISGEHAHPHQHEALDHSHPHADDVHHRHPH